MCVCFFILFLTEPFSTANPNVLFHVWMYDMPVQGLTLKVARLPGAVRYCGVTLSVQFTCPMSHVIEKHKWVTADLSCRQNFQFGGLLQQCQGKWVGPIVK